MKKFVIAAAVAAVGSAFAVESANIVGVQQDTTVAGFNWYTPPFATIGQDTITCGSVSISGDDVADYSDNIQVLDENGDPSAQFYWVGDGWFDMDGYVSGDYMNDEVIVRGSSFIIETESAGVAITCAGEVANKTIEFTGSSAAGFNWVGNPFPKAITYGDVTISGDDVVEYSDNIQVLDENGDPSAQFYWVGDGWFDMDGYVSGDYMTDEEVPAGTGFIVETESAGVTITINGFSL